MSYLLDPNPSPSTSWFSPRWSRMTFIKMLRRALPAGGRQMDAGLSGVYFQLTFCLLSHKVQDLESFSQQTSSCAAPQPSIHPSNHPPTHPTNSLVYVELQSLTPPDCLCDSQCGLYADYPSNCTTENTVWNTNIIFLYYVFGWKNKSQVLLHCQTL